MESEKMELRLINPNESGFLQHIEWNSEEIRKQVLLAVDEADVILFVVDVMNGVTDLDMQVAAILMLYIQRTP